MGRIYDSISAKQDSRNWDNLYETVNYRNFLELIKLIDKYNSIRNTLTSFLWKWGKTCMCQMYELQDIPFFIEYY